MQNTNNSTRNTSFHDIEYEQVGCLGHGGFASVFLAKKRQSGREVVLKVFLMDTDDVSDAVNQTHTHAHANATSQEDSEAFTREISILKKLQERQDDDDSDDIRDMSIVYHESWFQCQNFYCIVMKYCNGGTLAQHIDSRANGEYWNGAPFSERRIAWYALQLIEALAYIHDRGIVHYDVKSANVLIDWESGGTILLADLGSAVEKDEDDELQGFTKSYAPPELLLAYDNDNYDAVDGEKVDSFGLGCILLELICCRRLLDIVDDEDCTLAELIQDEGQGLDAILDEKCVKLPWLPPESEQQQQQPRGHSHEETQQYVVGYSFALKSLLKTLLDPDPLRRWTPSQLEIPFREDPNSPLIADVVTASHTPVPGDAVSMDNIQLGMFVQHGPHFAHSDEPVQYEETAKTDASESIIIHAITAMDEYEDMSFEEMRVEHYLSQRAFSADNKGIIGVISKIDPDALYAEAIWPITFPHSSLQESSCYRIGAQNQFELQVGPVYCNDFFDERNHPARNTGVVSTNKVVQWLKSMNSTEIVSPGLVINGKFMLVYSDPDRDVSLVAPLHKVQIPFHHDKLPVCPNQTFVGPREPSPHPEYWNLSLGKIVDEDVPHLKDAVTEMFFSENVGMNIQHFEITSIQRVQIEELWSVYAQAKEDVAAENWGVSNERYLFLGTYQQSPEDLLQNDPQNFFYNVAQSVRNPITRSFSNCYIRNSMVYLSDPTKAITMEEGKIHFTNSSLYGDANSFKCTNNERKLIISRVACGREISNSGDAGRIRNVLYHSETEQRPDGCIQISICNPFQAYPEYIITYKCLLLQDFTSQLQTLLAGPRRAPLFVPPTTAGASLFDSNTTNLASSINHTTTSTTQERNGRSLLTNPISSPSSGPFNSTTQSSATIVRDPNTAFHTGRRDGTTSIPYQETRKLDGTAQVCFQSITAMNAYQHKSFEELRMEDYARSAAAAAIRNASSTTSPFSLPAPIGTTTSTATANSSRGGLFWGDSLFGSITSNRSSPLPARSSSNGYYYSSGMNYGSSSSSTTHSSQPTFPFHSANVIENVSTTAPNPPARAATRAPPSPPVASTSTRPVLFAAATTTSTSGGTSSLPPTTTRTGTSTTTNPAATTASRAPSQNLLASNKRDDDNKKKEQEPVAATTTATTTTTTNNTTTISPNNHNTININIKKCVVCLEKDVRRILLPCGHPCLCEVCGTTQGLKKLRYKCPECRSRIREAITVFGRILDD